MRQSLRRIVIGSAFAKGRHVHQCTDQTQQCLLFRSISAAQKLAQLYVGEPSPGRGVRLINDESVTVCRLAPEEP